METTSKQTMITVEATVNAPVEKVWKLWTLPEHITKWNNASEDWHSPSAQNDIRAGGKFNVRMEAKDGSAGFDFNGTYDNVIPHRLISYKIEGGRTVKVTFIANGKQTRITESFEAETENPIEMQKSGWQAILNNFKKYAESN